MLRRRLEIQEARAQSASLQKIDLLERQLQSLQQEFARMTQPGLAVSVPGTPYTPQPPGSEPHSNPTCQPTISIDTQLDFLEGALDAIVADQEDALAQQEDDNKALHESAPDEEDGAADSDGSDVADAIVAAKKALDLESLVDHDAMKAAAQEETCKPTSPPVA